MSLTQVIPQSVHCSLFIAILRLVRYGNVPLPKAGEHFHVLQSHGNRYIVRAELPIANCPLTTETANYQLTANR